MKVKGLIPSRLASSPRTEPTKETEVDIQSVAYCTIMEWVSTGRDFQQFKYITKDTAVSAPSVRVLFLYLTKTDDSAQISYGYNPVNVIPVTENIDDILKQLNDALGIAFYRCTLTSESHTPAGYPTKGLMIDRRRYRPDAGAGDCWINLLTVTQAIADLVEDPDHQEVVIQNWHPQPVPSLEYRLRFKYDPNFLSIYDKATSSAKIDYESSFPPDDGSGDWFYGVISKVADFGRHGALGYASNDMHRGGITPFGSYHIKPPQLVFWMARLKGYSNIMVMLNYDIRNRPDLTNYTSIAMDMANIGIDGEPMNRWGVLDYEQMQYWGPKGWHYQPQAGYGEVQKPWTMRTVFPLLPLMINPYLFDRQWTESGIAMRKQNNAPYPWFTYLYKIPYAPAWMKLNVLADAGTLPAGESMLLNMMFNVLAEERDDSTIISFSGSHPNAPAPGQAVADNRSYNQIRFAVHTIPAGQMIWDVMDESKGENVPGYINRRLDEVGAIDLLYTPYPVTEKFSDFVGKALLTAGYKP